MDELTLRHSTDDDVPAMLAVSERRSRRVTGRATAWSEAGLRRMRSVPTRDAGADFPVLTRDGRIVGRGGVIANEPYTEVLVLVQPDPDLMPADVDDAASLLVLHAEGLAHALPPLVGDGRRLLSTEVVDGDDELLAAVRALGFREDRNEYEFAIDLATTSVDEPRWPDGVHVEPVRGPQDTDVVTDLLGESFAGHPGDVPFSREVIEHVLADVRTDASVVVLDAVGPVGVLLCRDRPAGGYVWAVGVLPRARRRGLGIALLQHAFRAYAAAGVTLVTLDADGSNESGALSLYQQAGMHVRTLSHLLTRPLDVAPVA